MLIVFCTAPDKKEAKSLAEHAVSKKLAGCVQIIPGIESVYEWEGEIQSESEHLLLFKTTTKAYPKLKDMLERNHSYDVPEVIAVPSEHVSEPYLKWLNDSVN